MDQTTVTVDCTGFFWSIQRSGPKCPGGVHQLVIIEIQNASEKTKWTEMVKPE